MTPSPLYPLRFEPIFRRYVWGGRRLADLLNKTLPPGDDYAESWEIVDRGPDQSRVLAGPLASATLGQLVRERGQELLGRHHPQAGFPLLFKFLDAQRTLSVQVHPGDQQAAKLSPPDLGKTEAWVVLAAKPGSLIYAGLKPGCDRRMLELETQRGNCQSCLYHFEPRVGDCIHLPAGAVHAIGEGLLIAEIQQSSDVTYRLYDWNRQGADGKPRPLHVEQALEAIDFSLGPIDALPPQSSSQLLSPPVVEQLVACDKFVLRRWNFSQPITIGGHQHCHLLAVLAGAVEIAGDPAGQPLTIGHTALLPASVGKIVLSPRGPTVLLDICLP